MVLNPVYPTDLLSAKMIFPELTVHGNRGFSVVEI